MFVLLARVAGVTFAVTVGAHDRAFLHFFEQAREAHVRANHALDRRIRMVKIERVRIAFAASTRVSQLIVPDDLCPASEPSRIVPGFASQAEIPVLDFVPLTASITMWHLSYRNTFFGGKIFSLVRIHIHLSASALVA